MRVLQILAGFVVAVTLFSAPLQAERAAQSNQIGAQDHPHILAQFGGAIEDAKLSAYVDRVGKSLVALTEEWQETWTFTVLDSPVVNAFALPGGYVYVTRGLLALANNEAELAGVLGHEIGHVISGHGELRIKRGNRAGLGVILGTILGGVFGGQDGAADAIELGAKLASGYLAQHSQSEELAADLIGVRLLVEAGYDPFAAAGFLEQLAAKEALERKVAGQQHNPNRVDFFASHPATAQRTKKAIKAAKKSGLDVGQGALKEREYLGRIDGIVYGDTAKEGYVRGRKFSHPELGFTFTVPAGFILANFSDHVEANNKTRAKMILSGDDRWNGGMDRYLSDRWMPMIRREVGVSQVRDLRSLSINGLDAAMATINMDTVDGPKIAQLTAIRYDDSTIRIVALSLKTDGKSRNGLNTASQSFRRLTKDEIAGLAPYHLRIVTVKKNDTVAKLAASMPLTGFREEQFKAMNGYSADKDMRSGDLVKIVE